MDKKLFREVFELTTAKLLKDVDEAGDPDGFLNQRKTELMAKLLKIDYAYMRTEEGRNTLYVTSKIVENMPKLKALLGRNRLLGKSDNLIG